MESYYSWATSWTAILGPVLTVYPHRLTYADGKLSRHLNVFYASHPNLPPLIF